MVAILVMWSRLFLYNLYLIGQAVSDKKMFENNGHIHAYSPEAGTDNSLGSKLFHKHKSSINLVICCKFSN